MALYLMKNNKVVSIWVDKVAWGLLKSEASKRGLSVSKIAREAIWKDLEALGHTRPVEPVDPELLKGLVVMKKVKDLVEPLDDFNERFKALLDSC